MPTLTGTLNGMAAAKILFSYFCVMAKTNEMLHPGMWNLVWKWVVNVSADVVWNLFLLLKLQIWRWSMESRYLDCSQCMIQRATRLYHLSLFDLPTKWSNKLHKVPALSAGIYWAVWPDQIKKLTLKLLNKFPLFSFLRIGLCPSSGRCLHSTMWYEVEGMFIFGGGFESKTSAKAASFIFLNSQYLFLRRNTNCLILRPSSYRAVKTFQLGYKNQSVYDVSGTSRCWFRDKYEGVLISP